MDKCVGPRNVPGEPNYRQKWEERYRAGPTPWDTGITPPEVRRFWAERGRPRVGRAIDLGCGTGTNALYLAQLGLQVMGVDVAGPALAQAQRRLAGLPPEMRRRLQFVQADVSRLPCDRSTAAYILDIGCLHSLPQAARRRYADRVTAVLRAGGYFHLYAFDRAPEQADDPDARGMGGEEVAQLFAPALSIVEEQRGQPSPYPCRWYLLRKRRTPSG